MWLFSPSLLVLLFPLIIFPVNLEAQRAQNPTARDVVNQIRNSVNVEWMKETVDTFKAGDPGREVTGIVTTFMATQSVLEQAAREGHNLVITHEPTFYYHYGDRDRYGENVAVVEDKLEFIEEHNLIIFRFHDHWHRTKPDGIIEGMMRSWGWENYLVEGEERVFQIPPQTLNGLAAFFDKLYPNQVIRAVGNPELKIERVGFAPGASGSMMQIGLLKRADVQAVIGGEGNEWEAVEYTRDAVAQGKPKGLIYIGHANSEEAGMKHLVQWLKQRLPYDLPIKHIPAGNPFWSP
ncbi:MAG: Nif3-like dinuclear metal center hexameric protein [Balneolaceae bacterium]|nr:Nif3-like dinuclear metal center hexameric protein [Balneolaceae bacterium]